MRPLAPPMPSMTIENPDASTKGRSHGSAVIHPNTRVPPRTAGDLKRRADGENREERGHGNHAREHGLEKLDAGADLRMSKQMMNANRHRENQQLEEGNAPLLSL